MQKKINEDYIFKRIKDILKDKLGLEESEFTKEASLSNDLGADSLDIVELGMEFEKEFDIKILSEFEGHIETIGDFILYIFNYKNKNEHKNYEYFEVAC